MSYFYNDYYSDPNENDEGEGGPLTPLELHVEMYALGDKYQIPGLSRVARDNYRMRLETTSSPTEFLRSISRIYTSTPESNRELRMIALLRARSNIERLQSDKAAMKGFKEICRDIPEFTLDLLQVYIDVPIKAEHICYCDE